METKIARQKTLHSPFVELIEYVAGRVKQHGMLGCVKIGLSLSYLPIVLIIFGVSRKVCRPAFLNIGGGPDFHAHRWLNLERVGSWFNPKPFELGADCRFPVPDASMDTVYTSHCLEHLDIETVSRVLTETHRVLRDDGRFIIKIPDFDMALERWRGRDASFFDERWGYKSVVCTWANREMPDCLDYRAAALFCAFGDEGYGDHYSHQTKRSETAFHGPPSVEIRYLQELVKDHSPSEISAELRQVVLDREKNFVFNHQNAWSRRELESLLRSTGFRIKSFDKEHIISDCRGIPGILAMKDQSTYCWAEKKATNND